MHLSTALNHKDVLIQRVNQVYRDAARYMWTSDQLLATFDLNVYGYEPFKRCPRWLQSFIQGYKEAMHHKHWELLEWVLPWEGVMYKSWTDLPEEGQKYYMQPLVYGVHVYKKDNTKRFTGNDDRMTHGS